MTKLLDGIRPVRRETAVLDRGRPLVIELWPRSLAIRVKGDRKQYLVSYGQILLDAARRLADLERAERWRQRSQLRSRRKAG